MGRELRTIQVAIGATLGPQDCWLLIRGIRTLAAGMEIQQRKAQIIASWLTG